MNKWLFFQGDEINDTYKSVPHNGGFFTYYVDGYKDWSDAKIERLNGPDVMQANGHKVFGNKEQQPL